MDSNYNDGCNDHHLCCCSYFRVKGVYVVVIVDDSVLVFLETDYVSLQKNELIVSDDEHRYFFKTISLLEPKHTHPHELFNWIRTCWTIVSYARTHTAATYARSAFHLVQ